MIILLQSVAFKKVGPVAQRLELTAHNRLVGGSSPPGPTILHWRVRQRFRPARRRRVGSAKQKRGACRKRGLVATAQSCFWQLQPMLRSRALRNPARDRDRIISWLAIVLFIEMLKQRGVHTLHPVQYVAQVLVIGVDALKPMPEGLVGETQCRRDVADVRRVMKRIR